MVSANYKDEKYFYLTISKIKKVEKKETRHVVLWILIFGRVRDYQFFKADDLKYFEPYVNEENIYVLQMVIYGLPYYIYIAPIRTLKMLSEIIRISGTNQLSHSILFSIFKNDELLEKFPNQIRDFLFQSTLDFRIDADFMSSALIFLDTYFDFDTLIEYLKLKFEHQNKSEYFFGFPSTSGYINSKKSKGLVEKDFLESLQKFVQAEENFTFGILDFIKPSNACSSDLIIQLEKSVKTYYPNKDLTIRFCEGLSVFEMKNEVLIKFLIKISNKISNGFGRLTEEELIKIFSRKFYYNSGLKSGTPGEPFPHDVRKQKLLLELLENEIVNSEVELFLKNTLKTVESSMEDDRNYGQGEKW